MELPVWSDKDRLFVTWPLGITLNFKFIAKKFKLVKAPPKSLSQEKMAQTEFVSHSKQERLHKQIEASKYEELS